MTGCAPGPDRLPVCAPVHAAAGADQHRVRRPGSTRCGSGRSRWAGRPTQIVTIDTDQGQSGASAADREGFQRLVAEVGMGRAGIVLGLEVSRLARNNADWHRLLEICALSGTLICDEDGLYDPAEFNDRLLLGLKGTMSEAELHFIRARLRGGQLSKARRGELQMRAAGRAGLRPGRQGRARPRHRGAAGDPPPVHRVRPHRLGPRGGRSNSPPTGCCSRCGSAPGPARASWRGCRCSTGGCCAPCTTPATPARSSTAAAANAVARPTARRAPARAPRAVDRADPRRPPRLHQPGTNTRPTSSCCWATPPPTAPTAPPAPPGKAPRCCRAWPSAGAADGG